MQKFMSLALLAFVGVSAIFLSAARAEESVVRERKARLRNEPSPQAELLRILTEPIETKDFTTPMTLKDALGLLYEKFGARNMELPVLIDSAAYRRLEAKDDPYETPVSVQPVPRVLSVGKLLAIFAAKIPQKSTFIVRDGYVEIVPEASPEVLLQQRVLGSYKERPLGEVLQDVADHSGISIAVDPRLATQVRQPVSATFNNDVGVREAVTMLARIAGLRAEFLGSGALITGPPEGK